GRYTEQALRKPEKLLRKDSNFFSVFVKKPMLEECYKSFVGIDEATEEYVKYLTMIGRFWSQNKEFEVNLEDKRLEDIVNSDEACIFIINHDHQAQDPVLLGCITNLLYTKYLEAGKGESCPRPNIIMNEDIIDSQPEKLKAVFEKFGAIGVDASLIKNPDGGKRNLKKLLPMIDGFVKDSRHVFIFPEGKMTGIKGYDLKQKFQSGIGEIIKFSTSGKDRVKVVPLGFDYKSKKRKFLGSIYVGEPVYIKQVDKKILVSTANVTRKDASPNYSSFFLDNNESNPLQSIDGVEYKVLTVDNEPVKGKETKRYISGVLAENLRICKNRAHEQITKELDPDSEIAWV
ncbi:MAG: hypothetical protein AB7V50_07050, partial [Vampirovibrionia bacterium]